MKSQFTRLFMGATLVVASAFGISSCSNDDAPKVPVNDDVAIGASVKVVTDPTELSKYVTNYKTDKKAASKKVARSAQSWAMPDLSAMSADYELVQGNWPDMNSGGTYVIPEGTEYVAEWGLGMNANNTHRIDLIVLGKLTVKSNGINLNADVANIYVGSKGEINDESVAWDGKPFALLATAQKSLYLYNGGKVSNPLNSYNGAKLYVEGDLTQGDLELGGPTYIGGTLTADHLVTNNATVYADNVIADSWTYNNDSKVIVDNEINIDGDVVINAQNVAIQCQTYLVGGDFHMENNSVLYAYEHLGVQGSAEVSTQGVVETPCMYVKDQLYIKNSATLNIRDYIYCDAFDADASGFAINMGGNALINANKSFTIQNKGWSIAFDNTADTQSAIVADKFQIMEGEGAYIKGYVFLSAKEYWGKPSENFQYYAAGDNYTCYNLQETVKATFGGVTIKSDAMDCNPEFTTPSDTPEPPKITELISTVEHTHDISATCVALYGPKAYLSWHKRGTSIHGCLEALVVENDIARLTSWMEVDDETAQGGDNWGGNSAVGGADALGEEQGQFDFNHLIVAEGKVVTVGDNAKMGGFIGTIALDGAGDFGTNGTLQQSFKSRQLLGKVTDKIGRSGNTVVYNNGKYYIACAGGFQEYVGSLDDIFVKENNKWKATLGQYELTDGSAKHIALNPAGDKVATLEFTSRSANVQDGDDYWFNDTSTAFDAKLKVRPAANWLNATEWEATIPQISPIYGKNTIAMDAAGNVYVSAGKQGLLVYNNGVKVGEFSIAAEYPGAGANGVAIDSQYVYVAYGIGGLWILNKSDLSVVSWYKSNAPEGYDTQAAAASANYVALDGKYIYVAYGRHGVKVLKLND